MRPPRPLPPSVRWAAKPVVISSANGLRAVQKAFELLMQGADTLDAVIEGVKIQELDPNDDSVGYGGLPNADGVVQLDASCMHGPSKRAGAVGALEGIKTPSEVAKLVLKYTNHIFLVGEGAKRFALQYGFKDEDLLSEHASEVWLHWRANLNPDDDYLDVPEAEHLTVRPTGTINCDAVTPQGDISSVTTTSGLAFKIPGRVGDSPIIGAGQYTDNDVGAAGSTGRGESNIKVCGGFLTVEFMRRGMKPTDACLETLKRVVQLTEPRLLGPDGKPTFDLKFYAVKKRGDFGAASLNPARYAAHDGTEAKLRDMAHLYQRPASSRQLRARAPGGRRPGARRAALLAQHLVPQPVPQPGRRVVDRAPLWAVQSRRLRRAAGAELRVDQPRCGRQYPGQLRVGRGRAGTSVVGGLAGRTHLRRRAREPTRLLRPGKRHAILARQPHDRRVLLLQGQPHHPVCARHRATPGDRTAADPGRRCDRPLRLPRPARPERVQKRSRGRGGRYGHDPVHRQGAPRRHRPRHTGQRNGPASRRRRGSAVRERHGLYAHDDECPGLCAPVPAAGSRRAARGRGHRRKPAPRGDGADGDVRAALRGGGRLQLAPIILQRSLHWAGQVDRRAGSPLRGAVSAERGGAQAGGVLRRRPRVRAGRGGAAHHRRPAPRQRRRAGGAPAAQFTPGDWLP